MTTHQDAKAAAETLARYFEGSDPSIVTTTPTPANRTAIALPTDASASMTAYYGNPIAPATRGENVLKWFNFPAHSDPRLYTRDGTPLSDHDDDGRPDHRLHKLCAPSFEAALAELWDELGSGRFLAEGLHVYCGGWAYRRKTGGRTFSTHAWGAAVDLNAVQNGWKKYETSFSATTFNTFERHGWLSGYRAWRHDAMHFQRAIPSNIVPGSYYHIHGLPKWIERI